MEKILELIKGEVCMGTYGLVELELRKLVEGQKPTTNSAMVPCVAVADILLRHEWSDSGKLNAISELIAQHQ